MNPAPSGRDPAPRRAEGGAISVKHLGIILRVHRRHLYLNAIRRQINALARGREVTIAVLYDRPSAGVLGALERHFPDATYVENAVPSLSDAGQQWMRGIDTALEVLREAGCEAGILWDDDLLFDSVALKEMKGHLLFLEHDRVEGEWLHLWDDTDHYNAAFPAHWAACLFRIYPGDGFPDDFVAHCPRATARSNRVGRLVGHLYHFGYIDADERVLAWGRFKRAGKVDSHTKCLTLAEPVIKEIHGS